MKWLRYVPNFVRSKLAGRTKVQASLYYASSSLICQGLRFAGVLVSTRAIDSEQFGLFAKAVLVMTITGLVREIGQSGALVAYQGKDERYVYFNFQLNLILGSVASCLALVSGLLTEWMPTELRQYSWLMAVILLLEALTLTNSWMFQKEFRFRFLGVVEIASLLAWVGTMCVLVGHLPGFAVLLLAQLAEVLTRCGLLFGRAGFRYSGFASGADLQKYYFVQFSRPAIPGIIVAGILSKSDYLLLSWFGSTQQLGVYERVMQFARIPLSLSINLCDKILLHSYSHAQLDPVALRRMLRHASSVVAGSVTVVTAVSSVGLLLFLKYLVGSDWSVVILALWWFSIPATLLTPLAWNLNFFFSGIGAQAQILRNSAIQLLVDLAAGIPLVVAFGASGMLLARAASTAALLAYQTVAVRRQLLRIGGNGSCQNPSEVSVTDSPQY